MRFYYLVAAYNEQDVLEKTAQELAVLPQKYPGSEVFILVNGSNDQTWSIAQALEEKHNPWLKSFHESGKGMGVAFRRGLRELQKKNLTREDWVMFCASDLPFGFSDLESFLSFGPQSWKENILFVGSKRHPESRVQRNWKRRFGSMIFEIARKIILNIKTKDTQGALFLRGDQIGIVEKLKSDDYFITAEIVYHAEQIGKVTEMPITLRTEIRNSKVSLLKDGYKSLKQLIQFRRSL